MDLAPLPFDSSLEAYARQAADLLDAYGSGDPMALGFIKARHPRFLDETIPWLPRNPSDDEVRAAGLGLDEARLVVARGYDFRDWSALADYVRAVAVKGSPARRFETAVEAVVDGDLSALEALLADTPALVRTRSARVTCFDPPVHRGTLLHYVAANGTEGHRQRTPPNAVAVATALLECGAEVDALADFYGAPCATMTLLVSSDPPAKAGLQGALVDVLLDHGAAIEGVGTDKWGTPLVTSLVFGCRDATDALVRRGARTDDVVAAAGLGRLDDTRRLLATADADARHRALALAAQLGHADVVELLLDAGEDPSRYNPPGTHSHATPLHQAVIAGHDAVVRVLVERGARLDVKDTIYRGTPLGWAIYGEQAVIESFLRARGAPAD